jgi:hypothetical protein
MNSSEETATFIGNTSSFCEMLARVESQFVKMRTFQVFFHWYIKEGREPIQFDETHSEMLDLMEEYRCIQNYVDTSDELEEVEEEDADAT